MSFIFGLPFQVFFLACIVICACLGFIFGWALCYRYTLGKLYKHVRYVEAETRKFRKAVYNFRKL